MTAQKTDRTEKTLQALGLEPNVAPARRGAVAPAPTHHPRPPLPPWRARLDGAKEVTSPMRVKVGEREQVLAIRLRLDDALDLRALTRCPRVGRVVLEVSASAHLPDALRRLAELPELVELHLAYADGPLPREIGLLRGLRSLAVPGRPGLSRGPSALPEELWSLSSLERLHVSFAPLDEIPDGIGALAALRTLDLRGMGRLSRLPDTLSRLSNLRHVDLQSPNELGAEQTFARLADLPALRLLRYRCDPSLASPAVVRGLSAIECLVLGRFTEVPAGIGDLRSLRSLDLGWNDLTRLPDALAELPRLESLGLESNGALDLGQAIDVAVRSQSLRSLHLPARGLGDAAVAILHREGFAQTWAMSGDRWVRGEGPIHTWASFDEP